jgi:hypothetical protein
MREFFWLVLSATLCGLPVMQQAAIGSCLSLDPFPFDQNGVAPSNRRRRAQLADALVISHLGFEVARQVIVLEQDAVLERTVPALDL